MNKKVLYGLIVIVVLAGIGFFGYQIYQGQSTDNSTNQETSPTSTSTAELEAAPQTVSYQGEEGKTALSLLQDKAEVEMTGEGEMAYVTKINGYTAKDNEFWAFYVNGEQAQVGAGSYVTKTGDNIEWKIETF